MEYKVFLEEVLEKTSEIALSYFGKVSGSVKTGDNNQVLTNADIEIGKYIVERIKQQFPTFNIIDEEAGVVDNSSEYTWVVDPIDGTSNFAAGVPLFGTIIGLLYRDKSMAGGISLPSFRETIIAEKGYGAYCNSEKIFVTKETNLMSALIGYGIDGHQEEPSLTLDECKKLADIILGIRNLRDAGSVYDTVLVAKGKYGAYLNRTNKIWDNVGQQIIIEEAGGVYTDYFGKPMDYSDPLNKMSQNYTWCFGAPILHKKLQEIVHR